MNEEQMENIRSECADLLESAQRDGRVIDAAFIDAGFVGVNAQIGLLMATLGRDSYESLHQYRSSMTYKDQIDRKVECLREIFSQSKNAENTNELASKLVLEHGIPAGIKFSLLRRYAPGFLDELFLPHMPAYYKELQEESRLICKLFPLPYENLHALSAVARRKQIFNEVASEVFTNLGFTVANVKRGLKSFAKPIGENFVILFSTDCESFESDYSLTNYFPSRYWAGMQLDHRLSVMWHEGRREAIVMDIGMQNSVAEGRIHKYDGSCSLEIAVRGYGFWYELAVKPLEKLLLESQ